MNIRPELKMSVDEFIPWAMAQDGQFELCEGNILAMSPERVIHGDTKYRLARAIDEAIRGTRLPCRFVLDSAVVRISADTVYQPDLFVTMNAAVDPRAVEVPEPLIVVEVLSPGTAARDLKDKLAGYFRVPSIVHYLIVDPDERLVIHHRRGTGEVIETRLLREGGLTLDPPGISLGVASLFPPGSEATP